LPEVVEDERWEDHVGPGEANRADPEMAHVGVERFRTGHGEENAAEHEKPLITMMNEEVVAVGWVERFKNLGGGDNSFEA
jgi:hypothetical protein